MLKELAAALAAEAEKQKLPVDWHTTGSGFGFLARPLTGCTVIELDYDYPAKLDDVPRWCVVVWRSGTAYETDATTGKLSVVYCESPSPSGLDEAGLARLARFAVGCVRLAPAVETVAEGEAGQVKPE